MEISFFSGFGFQKTKYEQKKYKKMYNDFMKTIPGLFELLLNNFLK